MRLKKGDLIWIKQDQLKDLNNFKILKSKKHIVWWNPKTWLTKYYQIMYKGDNNNGD